MTCWAPRETCYVHPHAAEHVGVGGGVSGIRVSEALSSGKTGPDEL